MMKETLERRGGEGNGEGTAALVLLLLRGGLVEDEGAGAGEDFAVGVRFQRVRESKAVWVHPLGIRAPVAEVLRSALVDVEAPEGSRSTCEVRGQPPRKSIEERRRKLTPAPVLAKL